MNLRQTFAFSVCVAILVGCGDNIAGKVDETDTSIAGLITPAGAPVPGAQVKIYEARDTSGKAIDSVITDENGKYSLKNLPEGAYALWAETDSSVFFRDSVLLGDGITYAKIDTLTKPRRVVIPVKVEPQHDPRIFEGQILGTYISSVVNNDSYLVFDKVPATTFPVRLSTSNSDYTPRTWEITIAPNSPDTLSDTLDMTFTGVPVVTGIEAQFDTLSGMVSLNWNPTDFNTFSKYQIYRDSLNAPELSTQPIASTTETSYTEFLGDNSTTWVYRIKIRSLDERVGISYYSDTVYTVNSAQEFDILPNQTLTMGIQSVQRIGLTLSGWFGSKPTVSYRFGSSVAISIANPSQFDLATDDSIGIQRKLIVTVKGILGRTVSDTAIVNTTLTWDHVADAPSKTGTFLPATELNGSVYLSVQEENAMTIYRSDDSCRTWAALGNSIASRDSLRASNVVALDGKLWVFDRNGLLHSSVNGSVWKQESDTAIIPIWKFTRSVPTLAVSQGKLVLAIEESADSSIGITKLWFWNWNESTKSFDPACTKNSKSLYLYSYWLTTDDNGFQLYTWEDSSSSRVISRYSVGSAGIVKEGSLEIPSSATGIRSQLTPGLSSLNYGGAVILADGQDVDKAVAVKNPVQWNPDLTGSIVDIPYRQLVLNLFAALGKCWTISPDGVFVAR